jgi:aconitate hydratase
MLPLTFVNPNDYDRMSPDDKVDLNISQLAPGKNLTMKVHPKNGAAFEVPLAHTFNEGQIEWFKNGSALNTMSKMAKHA